MNRTIVATAFLLAACAALQAPAKAEELHVEAELVALEPGPGCGVLVVGSPATYRVTSGPDDLRGKLIHVLIACIEMPASQGGLHEFVPGTRHDLILTRENVHRIEAPSRLTGGAWFYLKAAHAHAQSGTKATGS